MKKMNVMLADENQSYECYINESNKYWNGFLNPYFNKDNKDKFIKDMLKDLEDRVFSDNKNICLNHKLMSDLLSEEFNNKLGFHSMETEELLKFFFDFVNGQTEYMFSGFPSDVKNEIVENVLGTENYEFINELYQTEQHNNLYYFGSCYCWVECKKVKYDCAWDCTFEDDECKTFTEQELFNEYHKDSFGDDWEMPNGNVGHLKDLLSVLQSDRKYIGEVFLNHNMKLRRVA